MIEAIWVQIMQRCLYLIQHKLTLTSMWAICLKFSCQNQNMFLYHNNFSTCFNQKNVCAILLRNYGILFITNYYKSIDGNIWVHISYMPLLILHNTKMAQNMSFRAQMALYSWTTSKKGRGVDDTSQMARVIGITPLSLIFGVPRHTSWDCCHFGGGISIPPKVH